MRVLRALLEVVLWILIVATAAVIVAVYSGFVHGEDGINLQTAPPRAGTPIAAPTPSNAQRASIAAESDDSTKLPGRFVPPQGRQHTGAYPLAQHIPFCPEHVTSDDCYASNPPTSGMHLPVQGRVTLEDGHQINLPPDPEVYGFAIPRESIPHIEEHAGVYVGYRCASDACNQTIDRLTDLVTQELSLGERVVMSPDPDLDNDTIGLAAWTRVDDFAATDYTDDRVRTFIKAHSCRFDPELFCPVTPVN
jgi:hypothetical protein